ncbi:alpha/beta hydrolase fold-1 [Tanacetum coccineum]
MTKCFSFTASRNWCLKTSFSKSGQKSTMTDLGDGTTIHCWIPKTKKLTRPDLLLLHGFGANAMWQWGPHVIPKLIHHFNVYVPDLVFFGDSVTTRSERSDSFQAECVYRVMVVNDVKKDLDDGLFPVKTLEEAAEILLPQTPQKMKELMKFTFVKPPVKLTPNCVLVDFIDVSNIGDNADMVVIKGTGDAYLAEKPKEFYRHLKSFLIPEVPPIPSLTTPPTDTTPTITNASTTNHDLHSHNNGSVTVAT